MRHAVLFLATVSAASALTGQILNPRSPAEFEEVKGVVVCWFEEQYLTILANVEDHGGWTQPMRDQYEGLKNTQAAIVREVLNEGLAVYVIDDTSQNTVWGKLYSDYRVSDTLAALNIQSSNLHIVLSNGQPPRGVWSRDWGPFSVYENSAGTPYLLGRGYDSLLAAYLGRPFVPLEDVMDGGNFLTDGHGRIILSSLQPTIDLSLLGIVDSIQAAAYKVHIDYWMKMIDEETFVVNEVPESNYLPGLDNFFGDEAVIGEAIGRVSQTTSKYGRPYRFVKIRAAPTYDQNNLTYFTSEAGYVNSLIINRVVLVPQFDFPETDTIAMSAYRRSMPGYRIVGIPAKHFAGMGGTLHCITREIAADEPVLISHPWYRDSVNQTSAYLVRATILANGGISIATLQWTTDSAAAYQSLPMTNTSGNDFEAEIPGQPYGTRVFYYLEAVSNGGKHATKPLVAPSWAYNFLVSPGGYTEVKEEENIPGRYNLGQSYPNPFNPSARIRYEIPARAHVLLRVFNLLGEELATLVNEIKTAGQYEVQWNGAAYSSGVYFYRLEAGGFFETKKFMLLR